MRPDSARRAATLLAQGPGRPRERVHAVAMAPRPAERSAATATTRATTATTAAASATMSTTARVCAGASRGTPTSASDEICPVRPSGRCGPCRSRARRPRHSRDCWSSTSTAPPGRGPRRSSATSKMARSGLVAPTSHDSTSSSTRAVSPRPSRSGRVPGAVADERGAGPGPRGATAGTAPCRRYDGELGQQVAVGRHQRGDGPSSGVAAPGEHRGDGFGQGGPAVVDPRTPRPAASANAVADTPARSAARGVPDLVHAQHGLEDVEQHGVVLRHRAPPRQTGAGRTVGGPPVRRPPAWDHEARDDVHDPTDRLPGRARRQLPPGVQGALPRPGRPCPVLRRSRTSSRRSPGTRTWR